MSKNIDQVFIANPITSNISTDLMYFGQSPYGASNDAAMLYSNFAAQFGAPYTASALTRVNDTNVTLTLGGTPSTSLLQATSLTLGWTGQLAVGRGGTGNSTFTAFSVLCAGTTSTGAFQNVSGVGTSGQILTSNGAAALPTWQNAAVSASQIQNQTFTNAVDAGSVNALVITLSPAPSAYTEGQLFTVRAANNNTGTTTLNVNALGAKGVFTAGGNACVGGEIVGGTTYLFEYNGAVNAFNLINPSNITTNQAPQIQNQSLVYAVDSGAANAYVVTLSPAPGAYVDGMLVSFRATNANSGASTINVNSLGAKSIVTNANAALASGAILVNGTYDLIYNSSFGAFVLVNSSASSGGVTASQIQQQAFTYAVDSGVANAYVVTLSPAPSAYTDGMIVCFRATNPNTGASTINVNGLGVVNLTNNNGTSLTNGEILGGTGNPLICIYNSSSGNFYLINNAFFPALISPSASSTVNGRGGGSTNSPAGHSLAWGVSSSVQGGSSDYSFSFGSSVVIGATVNTSTYCFGFGNSINLNTSGFVNNGSYCFAFGNGITMGALNYSYAFGQTVTVNNSGSWVIGDSNASPNQDSASNQFNATFGGGYRWFIDNTPTLALSIDTSGNVTNSRGEADLSKTVTSPSSGGTVTLVTTHRRTLIDPSGTLATLTVNMPASPVDGQIQGFSFTQIITSLTVSGNGHTIKGNPASAAVGNSFTFIYNTATTTWYPTD